MAEMIDFDLAIIGSGFGGSLLALIARRLDLRVLLIERGRHPRFAIGESTSPLANLVLEQLCREYDLPAIVPLSSYGAWQATYPEIGCGLKRGFTFYHHEAGQPFVAQPDHTNELLVAASPSDRVADMHWLRADVDHFLARQAVAAGVEFVENTQVERVDFPLDGVVIQARTGERSWSARATFLVDASGPHGLLAKVLNLANEPWPFLPPTQALYSHFEGLPPLELSESGSGALPFPPERAAVHHVFDGGWVWSLRFDNGITSVGVAARPRLAEELALSSGEQGWQNLLDRFPGLEFFRSASAVRQFDTISAMPYRVREMVGPQWALLPSAAAFVDPFLSTGIPLTLIGIQRLAEAVRSAIVGRRVEPSRLAEGLSSYARKTLAEVDAVARLVSGCYSAFAHFELLSSFLMYYFAASSYAEIACRLGRNDKPGLFLRADDPVFQRHLAESCRTLQQWDTGGGLGRRTPSTAEMTTFRDRVIGNICRINVAGLLDPGRKNWYPVDLQDLVRAVGCYDMRSQEMALLADTLPT